MTQTAHQTVALSLATTILGALGAAAWHRHLDYVRSEIDRIDKVLEFHVNDMTRMQKDAREGINEIYRYINDFKDEKRKDITTVKTRLGELESNLRNHSHTSPKS